MTSLLFDVLCVSLVTLTLSNPEPPHIIFIIADDLGWNDVGFHGSNQIPTPNIDALAYDGVILNNYYVAPICTPSRSALMTGKYPIHTGLQHGVLKGAEARGLPLNETLLPQYLKRRGYKTHIVGKWHLGLYTKEYTPTKRGFDSHLGFWTGHQDYFDHTAVEMPYWGLDMRRGMEPAWDLHGEYSTDVFTDEAVRLVHAHNSSSPMFLYLAHAAVHSGNPYNPLPVHDKEVQKVKNIDDFNRRKYSAMVQKLDESVGKVVTALLKENMLENSIIVFTTDNGGPAAGFNLNAASNWPLRGVKDTLWEGGVRGAGLMWSPLIKAPRRVSSQLFHISDWLPTLYAAAGGDTAELGDIDGFNSWRALSEDLPSNRTQVLHNIDDIYGNAAITDGHWKLIKGSRYEGTWDGWYGPSGRDDRNVYDVQLVQQSASSFALSTMKESPSFETIMRLRGETDVRCVTTLGTNITSESFGCDLAVDTCIFNIKEDPCEVFNVANKYPEILKRLEALLQMWNKTALPPNNVPVDTRADPSHWGNVWNNFGDYPVLNIV